MLCMQLSECSMIHLKELISVRSKFRRLMSRRRVWHCRMDDISYWIMQVISIDEQNVIYSIWNIIFAPLFFRRNGVHFEELPILSLPQQAIRENDWVGRVFCSTCRRWYVDLHRSCLCFIVTAQKCFLCASVARRKWVLCWLLLQKHFISIVVWMQVNKDRSMTS